MVVAAAVALHFVVAAEVSQMTAYPGLDFDREELSAAMRHNYNRIIAFITTPEFQALDRELRSLAPPDRPHFVRTVVLQPTELAKRGIVVPDDFLIQTSAFGDRRPTLFAIKIFLPEKFHKAWENTNFTFNNEYEEEQVTRDPDKAWRPPLRVDLQNALISQGVDLESVD